MSNTTSNLTEKETVLFNSVVKGMDAPGSGWLHELADETLSTNGVLSSLTKKNLLKSHTDEGCVWVELTDEAGAALGMVQDGWGGWERA